MTALPARLQALIDADPGARDGALYVDLDESVAWRLTGGRWVRLDTLSPDLMVYVADRPTRVSTWRTHLAVARTALRSWEASYRRGVGGSAEAQHRRDCVDVRNAELATLRSAAVEGDDEDAAAVRDWQASERHAWSLYFLGAPIAEQSAEWHEASRQKTELERAMGVTL